MKVLRDLQGLRRKRRPLSMAAGFFDGVHRGHCKVIGSAMRAAREAQGEAWVLTFDTHPLKVLAPRKAPWLLTSMKHRLSIFERLGLDGCMILTFTEELASVDPGEFTDRCMDEMPTLRTLFVGDNWRYGRKGQGTPELFATHGKDRGVSVSIVRPVRFAGDTVSSTRIRKAVQGGQLDEAKRMLGRPFSVLGTVARGRTIGRQLGYPTANLDPHNEVIPAFGVYAVRALVGGKVHAGVLNHGVRPTFEEGGLCRPTLELHLFDFDSDVYGMDIEVFFESKLRGERRFASRDALKRQIARDVRQAERILARCRSFPGIRRIL